MSWQQEHLPALLRSARNGRPMAVKAPVRVGEPRTRATRQGMLFD